MTNSFVAAETAILLVDPYNDFMAEGGKLFPLVKEVAEKVDLNNNLKMLIEKARISKIKIFFVPHHRWKEGDYDGWENYSPTQLKSNQIKLFEKNTWGGTFHEDFQPQSGDIVVQEHWGQSGFANTDLDMLLKKHGIKNLIIVGFRVNTCIDSTARFGVELGYHVTLVSDATAGFSMDEMDATFKVNAPTYAHSIVTSAELSEQLL